MSEKLQGCPDKIIQELIDATSELEDAVKASVQHLCLPWEDSPHTRDDLVEMVHSAYRKVDKAKQNGLHYLSSPNDGE